MERSMKLKYKSVKFFGCVYDKDSAHPHPAKVNAMKEMPTSQSPTEPQSFLGMVVYLASFIPSLSTLTAPLWQLLTKEWEYTWNAAYQGNIQQTQILGVQ